MTRRTRLQCISIRGLLAALFFALMPIAHASLFSDGEARDQIAAERARLDDALKQLDALNTRLSKVEDQLKSGGLLDLQSQLDQLRQDLADLRGQIEVINNNIQSADKRQRDMYIDLDTRLRHLEQPGATNGTPNGTA
jgi:peptidoglycan hydrolase CwlO-like protein